MSNIVCTGGFVARHGKCIKVTGKAPKKARVAFKGDDYSTKMPSAMPSNEARQELRGTRKPQGVSARGAYEGQEMTGGGGAKGIIRGGSDSSFKSGRRRKAKKTIPSGPKMATVSGGTGHRPGTPNNADSHIVTNPVKGRTPRITNSKSGKGNFQSYMKKTITKNGDYAQSAMPSNNGTGGGQGNWNSRYLDSMGKNSGGGGETPNRYRDSKIKKRRRAR